MPQDVNAPSSERKIGFFEIAPQTDATSFQAGYLGLEGFEAWIAGDVLVKLDSESPYARGAQRW